MDAAGVRAACPSFHRSGAVAQLGEHLLCKQGVVGSIPSGSTNTRWCREVIRSSQDLRPPGFGLPPVTI